MNFPLQLRFKLIAISPQISVTDASGRLQLYVKQKAFKLKEAVTVFADEAQSRPLFRIQADRVLDISAQYHITTADGAPLGVLQRKGMRSLWRSHYEITRNGQTVFVLREENPWSKVMDGIFTQVPLIGMFSGYLFHPRYRVSKTEDGVAFLRATKKPAMWEGLYDIQEVQNLDEADETLCVLSILMMLLLERSRG